MSSRDKNLSSFPHKLPDGSRFKAGIVVAEWNHEVTNALYQGAIDLLKRSGMVETRIITRHVPGTFELPLTAQQIARNPEIDGVICLGCVIKGETPHFDFICNAAAQGIMDVSLKLNKPVIFGVLTTLTMEQAMDRAGGAHGNKGEEAAYTLLRMLS